MHNDYITFLILLICMTILLLQGAYANHVDCAGGEGFQKLQIVIRL